MTQPPTNSRGGVWRQVGLTPAPPSLYLEEPLMLEPLFRMPTGYQLSMKLQRAGGWTLIADTFYEGEPWSERDRDVYQNLSLTEAADVMLGVVYGG